MDDLNPYAAPAAPVADTGVADRLALAEPHTRLWAYLLDSLFYVLAMAIGAGVGFFFVGTGLMANINPEFTDPSDQADAVLGAMAPLVLAMLGLTLALFFWNCVLLYRNGQTLAKRIFNIRIVRPDGARASFPRLLFLRMLLNGILQAIPLGLGLLYWLIDSLFIVRADRRCIHDLIADTIVIKS